jgi:hypothetical protein
MSLVSAAATRRTNLLRRIDGFVSAALAEVCMRVQSPLQRDRGSVDPELMIQLLMIGHCYGLRSERKLDPGSRAAFRLSVILQA